MPCGLKRFQNAETLHFITFSCFHRLPLWDARSAKEEPSRSNRSGRRSGGEINCRGSAIKGSGTIVLSHPSRKARSLDGAQFIEGEPRVKSLNGPPASTWAPTISNPLAASGTLGGVVGRWVPILGEAVLVYQGAKFVSCYWASDDNY